MQSFGGVADARADPVWEREPELFAEPAVGDNEFSHSLTGRLVVVGAISRAWYQPGGAVGVGTSDKCSLYTRD